MADSYVFYRSFVTSLKKLPPEMCKSLLIAISDYALDGVEPDLPDLEMSIYDLVKPQIDATERRRRARAENGKLGGRPKETEGNRGKPRETEQNRVKPRKTKTKQDKASDNKALLEIHGSDLPVRVKDKLSQWMEYKGQTGFAYTEMGAKSLVSQVLKQVKYHGEDAVISCIDLSIGNGWQGIIWDKIDRQRPLSKAHNFAERDDDIDAESIRMMRQMLGS